MSGPPVEHAAHADHTEPVAAVPAVKQTERPHPLTPLVRGWIVLVAVALGVGRELVPNGERNDGFGLSDLRWILPVLAGVVVLAAVAGVVTWYFTRFVIDDEELRIETGVLFKNSTKVPFERIQSVDIVQPLAARIFSLAELRIEAGAGDSTIRLRYLVRSKASRLRDYLLARAHGEATRIAEIDTTQAASAVTDLGRADLPLVTVSAGRLVGSFVISTEWLVTAGITALVIMVTASFDVLPYAIPGVLPLVIGAISIIGRRVVAMFHFTLAESARGLRVTRGLTNLTSQSIPMNRIQGIKISQPLLWRPFGWYRVDVDILGYHRGDGENNTSDATSVLLPVATQAEVNLAVDRVLPGADPQLIALTPAPRRSAWVRWYDFWTLRYGYDDRVLITENGWFTHVRNVVPHAKTQSVRIKQGPLQRLLRLADVHVDTPKGPVNAVAHQLDATAARGLAMTQLDRARAARAADRARAVLGPVQASERDVLADFDLTEDALIGEGGESRVYALGEGRVLRIYRTGGAAERLVVRQLQGLTAMWAGAPLEVPQILQMGERAGRVYSVDRRFSGRPMSPWLAAASLEQRRAALLTLLDAAAIIARLPPPVPGFARLVGDDAPRVFGSLGELLHDQLERATVTSRRQLERDVPDVAVRWQALHEAIGGRQCAPAVVHGDLCPSNAYVDSSGRVTGIGDFSPHTLTADPLLDVTGAVAFLELETYPEARDDSAWLTAQAAERWGADTVDWIGVYRRYFGFYFSSAYEVDPPLYDWCLEQLRR